MIEERTEEHRKNYARAIHEAARGCLLMWPPAVRHPSAMLDNPRTSEDDIMWVIEHHRKQIELCQAELVRRWMKAS